MGVLYYVAQIAQDSGLTIGSLLFNGFTLAVVAINLRLVIKLNREVGELKVQVESAAQSNHKKRRKRK